jgi:alanyl-tRNA synthetase
VRSTAEIGLFKLSSETSSAANVRRIEAVTGPVAVALMREHDRALTEAARSLRVTPSGVPEEVLQLRGRVRELEKAVERGAGAATIDEDALAAGAADIAGASVIAAVVEGIGGQGLLDLADRLKAKLGDAAIVLGAASDDRVDRVAAVAPALVERGVRAGEVVKAAAAVVGGGGGGRDTAARAGGRDVAKLPDAVEAGRAAVEAALVG